MGLRRPSLSSVSTKPQQGPFRFVYRIPPARHRHDTDFVVELSRRSISKDNFVVACRAAKQAKLPGETAMLCGVIGASGARPPGDFCRELAIVRAPAFALVAQLDRASDFESEGREFESLRARQHSRFLDRFVRSNVSKNRDGMIRDAHNAQGCSKKAVPGQPGERYACGCWAGRPVPTGDEGPPVRRPTMPSENTARPGDEGKAAGSLMADGFAV